MDTIEYPLCLIIIFFKPLLFHHLFGAIIASTMVKKTCLKLSSELRDLAAVVCIPANNK